MPICAAAVLAVTGIALMRGNTPPEIHWKFLAGQNRTVDRVEELGWSAEGPAADYAVYSYSNRDGPACQRRWQEFELAADYDALALSARREGLAQGGRIFATSSNTLWIEGPGDRWRMILKRGRREKNGLVLANVQTYRNENFLGVARRWLRARFR